MLLRSLLRNFWLKRLSRWQQWVVVVEVGRDGFRTLWDRPVRRGSRLEDGFPV
jgi:hypothetical protein